MSHLVYVHAHINYLLFSSCFLLNFLLIIYERIYNLTVTLKLRIDIDRIDLFRGLPSKHHKKCTKKLLNRSFICQNQRCIRVTFRWTTSASKGADQNFRNLHGYEFKNFQKFIYLNENEYGYVLVPVSDCDEYGRFFNNTVGRIKILFYRFFSY